MEHEIIKQIFSGEEFDSVFEIGCANASFLGELKNKNPKLRVGGNDIVKSDIQKALKEVGGDFNFHNVSEVWPQEDNSYDIVFSVGVLVYVHDPLPAMREMLRVAKKKVILAEPYNEQPLVEMWSERDEEIIKVNIVRDYKKLFKKLGYEAEIIPTNSNKTIIKCKK